MSFSEIYNVARNKNALVGEVWRVGRVEGSGRYGFINRHRIGSWRLSLSFTISYA